MRWSLVQKFSVAAVAAMLIVGGASIADAADEDLFVVASAAPSSGAYAVAGEDTWTIRIEVADGEGPAGLDQSDSLDVIASESLEVSPVANPDLGVYTAQVSSTDPGLYSLSILLNGREADSLDVRFFSSGPDPSQSTFSTDTTGSNAACGAPIEINASTVVKDDQGTPMPGVDVTFTLDGIEPATATSDANGLATRKLTFTMPGHSVSPALSAMIDVDGTDIEVSGSPVSMNFRMGLGCTTTPTDVNWSLETSSQVAGLGIRMFIRATDIDNEIARLDYTKLVVTTSSTAVSVSSPSSRGDGSYVLSLSSATPGDYTVSLAYDGTVYGAPVPFTYLEPAAPPDRPISSDSYLFLSGWLVDPGDDVVATAVVVDGGGQGIGDAQVIFRASGAESFATTCMTHDDGRCSITFSSPVTATISVSASVKESSSVRNTAIGSEQQVTFRPNIPQYTQVSMEIIDPEGPVRADGDDAYLARITLLNLDGTPVLSDNPFIDITFTVIDTGKNVMFPTLGRSVIKPEGGGVYSVYLTSTTPGTFLVYASSSYDYSEPATLTFDEVPASEPGARMMLDCGELTNCAQILDQTPEVQAVAVVHDDHGLPEAGVRVDFVSEGATLSAHQCFTDDKGMCSIWVWLNGLGGHVVSASIDGTPLEGSPKSVQVLRSVLVEPPLATMVDFTVTPDADPVIADGTSAWLGTVTIESSDPYVWDYLLYVTTFVVTASSPSVSVGKIVDNGEGNYTVSFTSTEPGEFTVTSYFSGDALEQTITFSEVPRVPDPGQSSLVAASALADVGDHVVLTVMVKDSTGVAIRDTQVRFTAEDPGVLSEPTCTTDPNGQCTVSLSSEEAATIHVSAFVNDQEISGSVLPVRFQSKQPTQSASPTSSTTSPTSSSTSPTSGTTSATSASSSPTGSSTSPTSTTTSPTSSSTSPTSASSTPSAASTSSTGGSASPTSGTTSATSTTSLTGSSTSPTSMTTSPTSTSSSPTSVTTSPTSGTTSPTSATASPTSQSSSPTGSSTSPTSESSSPTGTSTSPTSASTSPTTQTSPAQSSSSASPLSPTNSSSQIPTGPTSSSTISSPTSGPNPPHVDLDSGALTPGQTLRITGENWVPSEHVRVLMYSTERLLATETVNTDGTLPTLEAVVPLDIEIGQHTIRIEGEVSGTAEASFTVVEPAPATAQPGAAAATGGAAESSWGKWVLIGFVILGVGAIVRLTHRTQRFSHNVR